MQRVDSIIFAHGVGLLLVVAGAYFYQWALQPDYAMLPWLWPTSYETLLGWVFGALWHNAGKSLWIITCQISILKGWRLVAGCYPRFLDIQTDGSLKARSHACLFLLLPVGILAYHELVHYLVESNLSPIVGFMAEHKWLGAIILIALGIVRFLLQVITAFIALAIVICAVFHLLCVGLIQLLSLAVGTPAASFAVPVMAFGLLAFLLSRGFLASAFSRMDADPGLSLERIWL
jgi:hypothetical protein